MVNRGFGHLGIGCYFEKYGNFLWSQAVLGGGKLRLKNKLNNYFFSANVMRRPGSAPTFSYVLTKDKKTTELLIGKRHAFQLTSNFSLI